MIPIERHQRILALVEQRGAVSINELTEILGVSHMTIRRDVSKLEEQGLLVSVSGGVRAVSRLAAEPSHLVKSTLQSEEKQAIGALAASHIAKNSCIYLDAGTTTLALARAILDRNDLQVVTNDFEITQLLIDASQCGVIHTGGTLCRENRSCVGESAARTLRHLAIDTAFISASGWDSRGIFTPDENNTPDENKVTVKETVSQVSARSILLCDSSKYNQVATFMALPLTRFTTIITDRHLSDAAASHIARHACEVLRAG
ncbi:DeoR/GlpR family DNA-binding transcription regulator [Klebsiella quasipneumoniae]|nr:DeoR/GlpR family DNA-binding transcription regulator [Klebsiella quasipneumoniae]MEB4704723.1 DeoR/GlpR family DNA-binding transcription regulator [Klebsiella quasipneumoniae]